MEAPMQCPRCQTDLISSFPYGFISKPVGPVSTYLCSACKFLFAKGADLDNQEFGFPIRDSGVDPSAEHQSFAPN